MTAKEDNNKGRFPFGFKGGKGKDYYKAVPLDEEGNPDEVSNADKAKGAAQMAAGTVITAAGIPMLILPGPGAVAIMGGAALTLKGHRTMTGREALPIEKSIDDAASRMATIAKNEAVSAGHKVARKASDMGAKIADEGPAVVADAVRQAPGAVADAVKQAPGVVASAVSHAPEVASTIAAQAPEAAEAIGRAVSRGSKIVSAVGSEAMRQGSQIIKDYNAAKGKE